MSTREARLTRLESRLPERSPDVRLLGLRAPYSWLPRGVSRLTEKQSAIFLSPARFRVVVAGRRSGKSFLAIAELIRAARSGHNKLAWYVAPSYRQAKTVLWAALKSAIPPPWLASKNEVDLTLTLKGYDSTIALRSADSPDSLRGAGLDFVVLDEYSSIDPIAWSEALRPALADKVGHALIMGSPRGFNHLYDIYTHAHEAPGWAGFHFSTEQGGLVNADEIALVKSSLDPITYSQEFLADFTTSTSRVYLMFDRHHNVRADLVDPDEHLAPMPEEFRADVVSRDHWERQRTPLYCGLDFNVSPMSCVIAVKMADELHVIDEIVLHNSHTQEMSEVIKAKYPGRTIHVYPDPSGGARKTSASGHTDFTILKRSGFSVRAPRAPYATPDKTNTVNSLLCSASGRRRLFIHPRCRRLIESLEKLSYRQNTNMPDKSTGFDHLPDALAYLVCLEFPIRSGGSSAEIRGV